MSPRAYKFSAAQMIQCARAGDRACLGMGAARLRLPAIAIACLAIAPASGARADQRDDQEHDRLVEDWVGTWRGVATWTDCTAPGPDALAVTIRWRELAPVLDGAAIFDGLGELWPEVTEARGLRVARDDITVELTAPASGGKTSASVARRQAKQKPRKQVASAKASTRAKTSTITLRTASQCVMTAQLTRDGTGLGACDDLIALADVAAGCPELTLDDDPVAGADGWSALTGKARRATERQCGRDATALRASLVRVECLPVADDPSQIAACQPAWQLLGRIGRCDRLPAETKQMALAGGAQLRRSLRATAGRASAHELAAAQCAAVAEDLQLLLDLRACP